MQIPLLLEVADRPVLCVGAGPVAAQKVVPMLRAGARVTVIAPEVHDDLARAAEVLRRPFAQGDVGRGPRPRLVVAATGSTDVDDAVAAEADAMGIWCLRIAGRTEVSVPAVVRRGDVVLTLTTGAPALSRRLREVVDEVVDERWAAAAAHLAALRRDPDVRAALAGVDADERRRRWDRAVDLALDPPQVAAIGSAARDVLVGGSA